MPLRNDAIAASRFVDQRAAAMPLTRLSKNVAMDKHLFLPDAHLQRHTAGRREVGRGEERGGGAGDGRSHSDVRVKP